MLKLKPVQPWLTHRFLFVTHWQYLIVFWSVSVFLILNYFQNSKMMREKILNAKKKKWWSKNDDSFLKSTQYLLYKKRRVAERELHNWKCSPCLKSYFGKFIVDQLRFFTVTWWYWRIVEEMPFDLMFCAWHFLWKRCF